MKRKAALFLAAFVVAMMMVAVGCSQPSTSERSSSRETSQLAVSDIASTRSAGESSSASVKSDGEPSSSAAASQSSASGEAPQTATSPTGEEEARSRLNITEDYRASLLHGPKPSEFQKYIVLHDTEGEGDASGVVDYWDSSGRGVGAHFIINKDGSIIQCVPLENITHHAGYGDTGHNELYGIVEDGRDDMVGSTPIGDWASDYGMNAWSIGIEMMHVGGSGDYPEAQLVALDNLIAYIDAHYGFQSAIIDHKAWRTGNSDTSPEFAGYLAN